MKILIVTALFSILMWTALPAFASTYYVSPTGNDLADGSSATPWKTLQHAADNVGPGDTVMVKPGAYTGFILGWDFPQNGTPTQPIQFQAEPGAIINRRNNKTPDGINLEGASYIHIAGFTIQNSDGSIARAGIRSVTNTNVVIRGNNIDGMGTWGIFTGFSENVLIENNETSHSISQHGIYVSNSADNPIIRGNRSWENNSCGIHMNGDVSQGGDGIISGALIERNMIHGNGSAGGSGINCDGVQNSVIQNNLLYDNHASGISLYVIDGADGSKNNLVANNTIIEAADGRWAINIQDGSTGNTVLNNVLFNDHPWHGSITISADSLPGFWSDHNVVEDRFTADDGNSVLTLSQWRDQTGQDGNSIMASQASVFINVGVNDYHLSAASPAINKGAPVDGVATDIEGTPRPQGSGWDIGAYEFTSVKIGVFQNGRWHLDMNDNGIWEGCTTDLCFNYGLAGDIPLMGDWDGDGLKTPGVYRPSTGRFFLRNSNTTGTADIHFTFGIPGDIPVAGDWTGKGYDSIGIYRPSNSTFYLRNSNTIGLADIVAHYGIQGDIPVVGDWTGKGFDSIGIYRPSNSTFYLRNSNTPGFADIVSRYGLSGDIPVVGDWDGNGTTTIGVYRSSNNRFYLRNSNTTGVADIAFRYGISGDIPLVGDWDRLP